MKTIIKTPHYELRCPYCSCHFSFDNEDIRKASRWDNGGEKKRHVECPHCKEDIVVENKENNYLLPIVKVRYKQ